MTTKKRYEVRQLDLEFTIPIDSYDSIEDAAEHVAEINKEDGDIWGVYDTEIGEFLE